MDHSKTKTETRLAAELAAMLAVSPGESAFHARMLCKAGRALRRIAENECNGWGVPAHEYRDGKLYRYTVESAEWRSRDEKRRDSLEDEVRGALRAYGDRVACEFNHDPRGPAVKLKLPRNVDIAAE